MEAPTGSMDRNATSIAVALEADEVLHDRGKVFDQHRADGTRRDREFVGTTAAGVEFIHQAMDLPEAMFPVMFAIPRTAGWLAQWQEMINDPEQKIARPRQIYLGHDTRQYVPIDQR